ncbi:MAG TPA: hypothetical protein VD997_04460 [Phycisphaerales bacterium]|nr:hypothetical protein [Phycisphaerales bacterium]
MFRSALCLAAATCLASAASAGVIHVSGIGGGFDMVSGSAPAFGAGPSLAPGALAALHAQLNADGITTDGRITFAAVDTDSGLAMVALIDSLIAPVGGPSASGIHFNGVSDALSLGLSTDPIMVFPSGPTRIAFGDFAWDASGGGDGFAWSNLRQGTALTWRFQKTGPMGLVEPSTFQYVTRSGDQWQLVSVAGDQSAFSQSGEFAFGATVTVVPSPAGPAVLALAGLLAIRRKRR